MKDDLVWLFLQAQCFIDKKKVWEMKWAVQMK